MFPFSESNSYPLSYYHSQENHNTFLQQNHHQNLFLGLPSLLNPPIWENPMSNNDMNTMNFPSNMINNNLTRTRGGVKKDRHTKISTAQGVRDRRVRLSISIARDFFNLQDMLGFDKASKTLGWLLAKSKAAIDELASTSKNNTCEGEVVAQNTNKEIKDGKGLVLSEKTSRKKRGRNEKCNFQVDAREVRRAKARERARERTKRKKMIINLNHLMENSSSSYQYNQKANHNLMICQSNTSTSSYGIINPEISVGESVVIKNKLRSGSCHNYNDNHEMNSKDYQEGCNYYNDYLTKFASESNGGILRQPGFPALNIINLSTEIHINGKPWDTSSSQILR